MDFGRSLAAADGDGGHDSPIGRCLGADGIDIVVARVQQAIADRGCTTTRVLACRQEFSNKVLTLTVIYGLVLAIRFADTSVSPTTLRNAIPVQPGDLLDLRDIERILENLKRLPVVEADIQIKPSKTRRDRQRVCPRQQRWRRGRTRLQLQLGQAPERQGSAV